jgi:hypothetical protein
LSSGVGSLTDSDEAEPRPPRLMIFMEYIQGGSLEVMNSILTN